MKRISAWWQRHFGPHTGRHTARPALPDPPAPAMVPEETSGQPLGIGDETAGAGVPLLPRYERLAHPQPGDTQFDLIPIPGRYRPRPPVPAEDVLAYRDMWPW